MALSLATLAAAAEPSDVPVRVADALRAIARSGVRLIFSSETIPDTLLAPHAPTAPTAESRLKELLEPFDLEARPLSGGGYVIASATAHAALALTVVGDAGPVRGALIHLPELRRSVHTDRAGRATLEDLAPRDYDVSISAAGFVPASRRLRAARGVPTAVQDHRIVLEEASIESIIVETSRYSATAGPGVIASRDALAGNPVTGTDAARALQVIPGTATGGYSALTHVRGSRDDETLLRFDGVTLLSPYHLANLHSLFSAIDPSVVESITSWTGVAPIDFNGRIGAVVDVAPRQIAAATIDARLSERDTSLFAATPLADGRGGVFVGGRASNSLTPIGWLDQESGAASFRDLVARANWTLSPGTELVAGFLAIDDASRTFSTNTTETARLVGHGSHGWLRVSHELAPGITASTQLSREESSESLAGTEARTGIDAGVLTKSTDRTLFSAREELIVAGRPRWSVRAGAEWIDARAATDITSAATFLAPFVPGLQPSAASSEALADRRHAVAQSLFADVRLVRSGETVADVGLRWDRRHFGLADTRSRLDLRVNVRRQVADGTAFRAGWGQSAQADILDSTFDPALATRGPTLRRLAQTNASVEQQMPHGALLRVEAYDKREYGPVPAYENVLDRFSLLPDIAFDREFVQVDGAHLYGVEATIEFDRSRALSGWLTYSWSRAIDRIAGRWVPRSWDQPHAAQLGAAWQGRSWRISTLLGWRRGWPSTPLLTSAPTWANPQSVSATFGPRNSARLDDFLLLDLRVSWRHALAGGVLEAFLDLHDLTDSRSECCREYSVVTDAQGISHLMESQSNWLTFTPILGIRWQR